MTSTHISCQYSQANAFICKETLMVIDIREVRPHDKAEWFSFGKATLVFTVARSRKR